MQVSRTSYRRRAAWALFNLLPMLRAAFYRMTAPLFFKGLGRGARIFGRLRVAYPFSDLVIGERAMLGHETFWQVGRTARVRIGDDFSLNRFSLVVINEGLEIGDRVAVAEFVSIRDSEHEFGLTSGVRGAGFRTAPITIEDNVWIGRGAYIGPGSRIGSGSIVAANAVVNGEFPPGSLIAGVPAKLKKRLTGD